MKPRVPANLPTVAATDVVSATLAELDAAGATGTSSGQSALYLARRIESDTDSGASLAQLTKALRESVAAAIGRSEPEADPIQAMRDELAARRDSHSA